MDQVRLLSNVEIPRSDLVNYLLEIGVQYREDPYQLSNYYLHTGEATVWIDLDDIEPHYPNPEIDALIEQKLGDPPRIRILLHISRGLEGQLLALDFACKLAQRWPFVLDNLSGSARRIYSLEELQALQRKGHGFWEDEKRTPRPKKSDPYENFTYIPPWQIEEYKSQGLPLPDWIVEELERQGLSETGYEKEEDGDYMSQVYNLLEQGLLMDAIKLYRKRTGVSLREAKHIVEAMKESKSL